MKFIEKTLEFAKNLEAMTPPNVTRWLNQNRQVGSYVIVLYFFRC